MKITVVTAIVLMLVTPTRAMDFTIKAPGTIIASGQIVFLDSARFRKVVDSMGDRFDTLILNSTGGIVAEAMGMAAVMDEHQPPSSRPEPRAHRPARKSSTSPPGTTKSCPAADSASIHVGMPSAALLTKSATRTSPPTQSGTVSRPDQS
jgi:hypothetical protein